MVIDYSHEGISRDLMLIADAMSEWEGPIADALELTPLNVDEIKRKFPLALSLQRLVLSMSQVLHKLEL